MDRSLTHPVTGQAQTARFASLGEIPFAQTVKETRVFYNELSF
jgi:hypothetical protein